MKKYNVQQLKNLIEIPSPSGYEGDVANFLQKELLKILPKKCIEKDFDNNIIATIQGESDKIIMIDAHSDQIGYSINNVTKEGLLNLVQTGYGDVCLTTARKLIIITKKGILNAVVNRKHSHLVDDEEDEIITDISEAEVDIGIRKRTNVLKHVDIGDPVICKPSFQQLVGNFYSGDGMDDKTGCFVLLETIKRIVKSKTKPKYTLMFTFSVKEEIGCFGALELVRRYKPYLFIEVDVGFATDYMVDSNLEQKAGRCRLGSGIIIFRGVNIHTPSVERLESIAKSNKIKFQQQATNPKSPYTSEYIAQENGGLRVLTLGIPLRNMHTPVETINLSDLEYGTRLLQKFLSSRTLSKTIE